MTAINRFLAESKEGERFLKNTRKTKLGCWYWVGKKNELGYGTFSANGFRSPHRWVYWRFNGEFDRKLFICHKCDNPGCVNPKHLYAGTAKDNTNDRKIRGRIYWKHICKRGHRLPRATKEGGTRLCYKCHRINNWIRMCRKRIPYIYDDAQRCAILSKKKVIKCHICEWYHILSREPFREFNFMKRKDIKRCPAGHLYTKKNLAKTSSGKRLCLPCDRERYRNKCDQRAINSLAEKAMK